MELTNNKLRNFINIEITKVAEEMIEKTRPDIVSIITPPALHFEHCQTALKKGCHVFCEKPIALSYQDCDDMVRACEENGVTFLLAGIGFAEIAGDIAIQPHSCEGGSNLFLAGVFSAGGNVALCLAG